MKSLDFFLLSDLSVEGDPSQSPPNPPTSHTLTQPCETTAGELAPSTWTSAPQHPETRNLCCVKTLLWPAIVMAAEQNQHTHTHTHTHTSHTTKSIFSSLFICTIFIKSRKNKQFLATEYENVHT